VTNPRVFRLSLKVEALTYVLSSQGFKQNFKYIGQLTMPMLVPLMCYLVWKIAYFVFVEDKVVCNVSVKGNNVDTSCNKVLSSRSNTRRRNTYTRSDLEHALVDYVLHCGWKMARGKIVVVSQSRIVYSAM
jgi:hypothetical protein